MLAESYYETEEYQKCLNAIDKYEGMNIVTFRKDHDFAKTLTIGVAAANEIWKGDTYKKTAEHYLDLILKNIETDDWTLRYVAAESYMDLYAKTKDKSYLQKAYDLAEENVNYLIDEQYAKNVTYLAEVKKQTAKKTDTDATKKEIKTYNKWIEEERKKELPPVYEPLVVNCELLFGLADQLMISSSEKKKVNDMLHSGDTPLFLTEQLENEFWFDSISKEETPEITFKGSKVDIPTNLLAQGTTIKVTVISGKESTVNEDWMPNIFLKMKEALKKKGYIYCSFKYGEYAGERNGRYFRDFTEKSFKEFIDNINELVIVETRITGDVRPGRDDEKWLNVILKRI